MTIQRKQTVKEVVKAIPDMGAFTYHIYELPFGYEFKVKDIGSLLNSAYADRVVNCSITIYRKMEIYIWLNAAGTQEYSDLILRLGMANTRREQRRLKADIVRYCKVNLKPIVKDRKEN